MVQRVLGVLMALVMCVPAVAGENSFVATYPASVDPTTLEQAVAEMHRNETAWQIETISVEQVQSSGAWRVSVNGSSPEGLFLAQALLPSTPGRNISTRIPILSRINNNRGFHTNPASTRYAFAAHISVTEDERKEFLRTTATSGIQLFHIAGNIYTGRGSRASILSLAADRRVASIELAHPFRQ